MKTCRCGHWAAVHRHDRPGRDCSQCGCRRYRWRWWPPTRPVPGDSLPPAPPPARQALAPGSDPPEWEPGDSQAQAIAELFADAAHEMDQWHG